MLIISLFIKSVKLLTNIFSYGILFAFPSYLIFASPPTNAVVDINQLTSQALWKQTAKRVLQDNFWSQDQNPLSDDAYYISEYMMAPMEEAFRLDKMNRIQRFTQFFKHWMTHVPLSKFYTLDAVDSSLNQDMFLVFASEYIALCKAHHVMPPRGFVNYVQKAFRHNWSKPAWIWPSCGGGKWRQYQGKKIFAFDNLSARIRWKLASTQVKPGQAYCHALADQDFMPFSIAAGIYEFKGKHSPAIINNAMHLAYQAFSMAISPTSNIASGWVLQPGAWKNYPAYQYAGCMRAATCTKKSIVDKIAYDSSHSMRLAIMVNRLYEASKINQDPNSHFFQQLRIGLRAQVLKLITPPSNTFPSYRFMNYMDGTNGLYRFDPKKKHNIYYRPYQNSQSLYTGWWTSLIDKDPQNASSASKRLANIYCAMAERFKVINKDNGRLLKFYTNTNGKARNFNSVIATVIGSPNPWLNGLSLLILRGGCAMGGHTGLNYVKVDP